MMSADDASLARELAAGAGRVLVELRSNDPEADPSTLGARGDAAAQAYLLDELRRRVPDDAILSEEMADDAARLSADRVWIIDPLDGTREYREGRSDWAVHVALWADGALCAGAVAIPADHEVFVSEPVPQLAPPSTGRPRVVVSRSRPPAEADTIRSALDGELVPMGSAGAKTMAVLTGSGNVYVHSGGQYEWDTAAPAAVAAAAGLSVTRLDGSPLEYNRPDPWSPEFLVCRPELTEQVLSALAATSTAGQPSRRRSTR